MVLTGRSLTQTKGEPMNDSKNKAAAGHGAKTTTLEPAKAGAVTPPERNEATIDDDAAHARDDQGTHRREVDHTMRGSNEQ